MNDDDLLAAALATGRVEGMSFLCLTKTARVLREGTIITNCVFANNDNSDRMILDCVAQGVTIRGCVFGGVPRDEMQPLYDLADEAKK